MHNSGSTPKPPFELVKAKHGAYIYDSDSNMICDVDCPQVGLLFVAAPELLKLAESFVNYREEMDGEGEELELTLWGLINNAKRLIDKAKRKIT